MNQPKELPPYLIEWRNRLMGIAKKAGLPKGSIADVFRVTSSLVTQLFPEPDKKEEHEQEDIINLEE